MKEANIVIANIEMSVLLSSQLWRISDVYPGLKNSKLSPIKAHRKLSLINVHGKVSPRCEHD